MPTSIDQPTVCACDSSAHLYPLCIYAMPPSLHSAVVRTRNTPNHLPHSHAHVIRTEEASVCLCLPSPSESVSERPGSDWPFDRPIHSSTRKTRSLTHTPGRQAGRQRERGVTWQHARERRQQDGREGGTYITAGVATVTVDPQHHLVYHPRLIRPPSW
mmetsp:Transcript_42186/g.119720  ORF Transcript_42186/g.119720 Transcript_42186/m.119720 type:complete len:159 (+) Transcript_42186:956-1432(+)